MTMVETSTFGTELRRWRQNRRLSQFDLALQAGTTQRYVSFIEQGRSRPGRSIVLRLAESLGLSLRERNALLLAAGYAPAFSESSLDGPELRPVRAAIESILDAHLPYPAIVVRPHGLLLAANDGLAVFTDGCAPHLLEPPLNTLRLALHPDGVAPRIGNLPEWGRHIVENLRAQATRSPDPELDQLIAELEGYLPATAPGPDYLGFSVPLRLRTDDGELRLITTLTSFVTAVDVSLADLQLEAFLPADETTAEILRRRFTR